MTVIITERLVLRPLDRGDTDALVLGLDNFNVSQWTARVPFPYGPADAAAFVNLCAKPQDGTLRAAITVGGSLIGVITYEPAHDAIAAELGYWLAEPFWGKGYGGEAAEAMTAHAFGGGGHDLLVAGYRKGNEASRRILERLGFDVTGERQVFSAATQANMPVVRMALARGRWRQNGGRGR